MLQYLIVKLEMAELSFPNITGIDTAFQKYYRERRFIKLKVEDFLNLSAKLPRFHTSIAKGTIDAISLNPNNAIEEVKHYVKSLSRMLKSEKLFSNNLI